MKKNQPIISGISFLFPMVLLLFLGCKIKTTKGENVIEKNGTNNSAIEEVKTDDNDSKNGNDKSSKINGQIPFKIIITNLESPKAPVMVTFYEKKNKFLSLTDILKTYKLIPDGNTLNAEIDDLKYGEYAIASFQDVNSNGVIDKKAFGIPKEPYGFSNNYKPKVRGPRYNNCKFIYDKTNNSITIKMIK